MSQQVHDENRVYTNDGGKTWGYIIELGQRPSGRCATCKKTFRISTTRREFCSRCGGRLTIGTSPRERRVPATHRTKAEALRARKIAVAARQSADPSIHNKTLAQFLLCEWLPAMEAEVEPTTWIGLKGQIQQHIVPAIGHIRLPELRRDEIRAMYQDLLQKPKLHGAGVLSKSSVQRIHACLHWALESLVESGRLMSNPADGTKPRTRKSEIYEIRIWSQQQLSFFLSYSKRDPLFALWHLLAWTGMRRGEALGLQWRDIRLEAAALSIRRALCSAGGKVYVSTPKSSLARVIELDSNTVRILRAHRRQQARSFPGLLDEDYIFTDDSGQHLRPTRVSKLFSALVEKSDLPRIRLHDLRHTHASHLIMSGANIKVVQERLGHANATITLTTYTHLMPTTQRTAIDTLVRSMR